MCSIRLASHVRKLFGANAIVVQIGPRQPGHGRRWERVAVAGLVDEGGAIGTPGDSTATRVARLVVWTNFTMKSTEKTYRPQGSEPQAWGGDRE